MMRIGKLSVLVLTLACVVLVGISAAEKEIKKDAEPTQYTLSALTEKIEKLEKKEVVLSGTIVGVCKSGCKMWIAEGEYKKGNPFALVRAKDDAFKFDTDATGKKVVLHGFAVAKYMDYCAESGDEQEGAMDKCDTPVETKKAAKEATRKTIKRAGKKESKKESPEKREVKDVTFFATKVEYK